jgi:hypothetical protein
MAETSGNHPRSSREPLRVNFADGSVCRVSLSASYQALIDKVPHLVARFGDHMRAEEYLTGLIEAAAFSVLERLTLSEVRNRRKRTAQTILDSARNKAAEIGFDLQTVEICEITQLQGRRANVEKIKILFLSANPTGTPALQLDREEREIQEKIRAAEHRDSLELITRWAVRPGDLLQYLNQYRPHVVHFSGHGSPTEEIVLLDNQGAAKPVSKEALVSLFQALRDNIRVVLLNACYSQPQAEAIRSEIDCAIGMSRAIGDNAAIVFAAAFYRAIGFGRSVREAFDQGKAALLLEGIPEQRTPTLLTRSGIAAESIVLINPR